MKAGLYHVDFQSANRSVGHGIVMFKDGAVNGGDDGYLYMGPLSVAGDKVSGQLHVKRWNPTHVSVFGPIPEFDLTLEGAANDANGTFTASGAVAGRPSMTIRIAGRFLASGH